MRSSRFVGFTVVCAIALALIAFSLAACHDRDRNPDAQQLARINKELALLSERVEALARRVARLEARASAQDSQQWGTPAPDTTGAK